MNRRDFLKCSAMAGTLPLFNIGCAGFGFSRQRQIADGAKIRVALIGCGLQTANSDLVEVSTEIAKHGIPMHMDKPLGSDQVGFMKMSKICEAQGVPLQIGYMFPSTRELVVAGIGRRTSDVSRPVATDDDRRPGDDRRPTTGRPPTGKDFFKYPLARLRLF